MDEDLYTMPGPWRRMRNKPYELSRSEQRRQFGQRAIKGPPALGTTPSEVGARYAKEHPGYIPTGKTPDELWNQIFKRPKSIAPPNLSPTTIPDAPFAASVFTPPSAQPSFLQNPAAFGSMDTDSAYMGSITTNAANYARRLTPVMKQLQKNTLGYDPLFNEDEFDFGF